MGGGQVLTFASTAEYDDIIAKIRGFILEAPFLGFAPSVQPSWLTVAVSFLSIIFVHFTYLLECAI